MKPWARAANTLKDHRALIAASFVGRSVHRNPALEAAVIKATNHNESSVDYRNAHRVYKWIRTSPANIGPFARAIAARMDRTRSWVVALKGLMLMHGVLCCKVPALEDIRQLPFDFSSFSDGHSRPSKMWGFNAFIRVYFAFLDRWCNFLSEKLRRQRAKHRPYYFANHQEEPLDHELADLQALQVLLAMLLQVLPLSNNMKTPLILEAMDCVIIEIFDVYGKICSGIARVLLKVSRKSGDPEAAATALRIIEKATNQGEELSTYFEFCKDFGVSNAHEVPKFVKIPQEDIRGIENLINSATQEKQEEGGEAKAIIWGEEKEPLKTIITEDWEVFDDFEELPVAVAAAEPAEDLLPPLLDVEEPVYEACTMPDLITF